MQDKDNQKNLLLAIVLSVSVLLFWQLFYAGPKLKDDQERRQRLQVEQTQTQTNQPGGTPKVAPETVPGTAPTMGGVLPSSGSTAVVTREAALMASPRVPISTPSLHGSIALKGGRLDDIVLAKYRETVEPNSPNVVLFSPSGAPEPYYAEYGWVAGAGSTLPVPDRDTLWRLEKGSTLTPDSPVTLAWDNGKGAVFRRMISVDTDYVITVTDEVENKSAGPIALYPYAIISRHGMPKVQGYWILHEGLIGVLGDAGLQEITYADALKEGASKPFKQTGGWLGLTDKYWAAALIPDQKQPYEAELTRGGFVDFGARLAQRRPNSLYTCRNAFGGATSAYNNCSWEAINFFTGESFQPPIGRGVITQISVRVGTRGTGPMRVEVLEAGLEHRGRLAVVLGGAHHDDGVDMAGLVTATGGVHLIQRDRVVADRHNHQHRQPDADATWPTSADEDGDASDRCRIGDRDRRGTTGRRGRHRRIEIAHPAATMIRRLTTSSRPITSSASNNGGPMVRPVTATRMGP